ncbi:MAG: TIGR01459 family HAD-type hydrolase [Ponticaulis sp.]|nr:TIGR01459 family HAD-type hydrolase [Ponticaulis sp.]|tara:strand:+ start:22882 stop:23739 length:858 start_codon:yes stop_codon:yes gene_type:complete
MTDLQFPQSLTEIHDRYDAIFCDVWGVIHNGRRAFDDACDALANFRRAGKPVILITNAPVQARDVERLFEPIGVRRDCYNAIASSGDATRLVLKDRAPGPAYRLGVNDKWRSDDGLFEDLGLEFAGVDEAEFIIAMGLDDPENDNPDDYRDLLIRLQSRNLTMVCANPDIQVRVGNDLQWCAGALARIYEELGGEVIYPGKPHDAIYELARRHLSRISERPAAEHRILAIGDGPGTDILGAMNQNLDSLYVGTGINMSETNFEDDTRNLFSRYGVMATYAMPGLC